VDYVVALLGLAVVHLLAVASPGPSTVLVIQTAAVAGLSIEGGNPVRNETLSQAVALDARLRKLWQRHPRFTFIPHSTSFLKKIVGALGVLETLVDAER
jgi:hypothetical protein